MKIKIISQVEKEVELSLPYFSKSECHVYAIISDKIAIQINYALPDHFEISDLSFMVNKAIGMATEEDKVEISKEEFIEIMNSVFSKLKEKLYPTSTLRMLNKF